MIVLVGLERLRSNSLLLKMVLKSTGKMTEMLFLKNVLHVPQHTRMCIIVNISETNQAEDQHTCLLGQGVTGRREGGG